MRNAWRQASRISEHSDPVSLRRSSRHHLQTRSRTCPGRFALDLSPAARHRGRRMRSAREQACGRSGPTVGLLAPGRPSLPAALSCPDSAPHKRTRPWCQCRGRPHRPDRYSIESALTECRQPGSACHSLPQGVTTAPSHADPEPRRYGCVPVQRPVGPTCHPCRRTRAATLPLARCHPRAQREWRRQSGSHGGESLGDTASLVHAKVGPRQA